LIGFAGLNAYLLWRLRSSIFEGYGDFASFYTAGRIVKSGQSAKLYDPVLQWHIQQEFAAKVKIRRGPLPYIRPPFEALLFLPLAYLPYPVAWMVWLVLKITLLLLLPFALPPPPFDCGRLRIHALRSLLCLAFFPVGFDLLQGQDSILLLIIVALALRLMLRGADLGSGALLALGLLKFHLILPLFLILALVKRGRIVFGFLITTIIVFLVSLAMVHRDGLLAYPRYLWRLNQIPEFGMVKPQSMPNLRGLVTVLVGSRSPSALVHVLLAGGVILGVVVAAQFWKGRGREITKVAFSFSVVVILVTSYYANSYDLTLLLLPLLLIGESVVSQDVPPGWPEALFLAVASVLLCTPLLWVLVFKWDQFCWIAILLFGLAFSIFALGKGRPSSVEIGISADQHRAAD
jgi:hypothetical protein